MLPDDQSSNLQIDEDEHNMGLDDTSDTFFDGIFVEESGSESEIDNGSASHCEEKSDAE